MGLKGKMYTQWSQENKTISMRNEATECTITVSVVSFSVCFEM